MKIELRSFTANQRFSEETLMFTAVVYCDGKRIGTVKNDGRGGANDVRYDDAETERRVLAWIKSQPSKASPYDEEGGLAAETGKPPTMFEMDEDFFFTCLANDTLRLREETRQARQRQKFISESRARGAIPFLAKLSDGSILLFEIRGGNATEQAERCAAKRKLRVLSVEEAR